MKNFLIYSLDSYLSKFAFYRNINHIMRSPEDLTDFQFKVINTYIFGVVSVIIILFSLFVNLENAEQDMLYVLIAFVIINSILVLGLYYKKISVHFVQPFYILGITCLSYYILITESYDASGSLVWIVLYPPVIMFSLGLKYGFYTNLFFFISLCILTLSPLNYLVHDSFSNDQISRFLISFLGAFIFSLCMEYVRYKTKSALVMAYKQNKKFAFTDPLTGLKNRRSFDKKSPEIIKNILEKELSYTIMFIDIDHFKSINDNYGHDVGDIVLQHLAQVLLSQKNSSDIAYRWGGEEFVLLMPNLNADQAGSVAERIRLAAQNTPCNANNEVINYTISVGYFTGNYNTRIDEAIKKADINLYKAKANNRNCTVGSCSEKV